MRRSDLVTQMLPRAQRLGLVDPATGFVDRVELETYLQGAAQYLAHRYQLQQYLALNRELLRTSVDIERYPLPPGHGFAAPRDDRHSGLAIASGMGDDPVNLVYHDPAVYELMRTGTTGRPAWFTVAMQSLYLMPVPDGVYLVQAIERADQASTEIPDAYIAAITAETLWRLAADSGKATQVLADERVQCTMKLVNDESRARQQFYESRERIGWGRRGRRNW